MRGFYLATAASFAATALAAPAQAQNRAGSGVSVRSGEAFDGSFRHDDRDRRRDRRRDRDSDLFIGEWPQQGDTAWRSDSFNDWWHDNPLRAFPRWVQNGSCERVWWSGGGWRC